MFASTTFSNRPFASGQIPNRQILMAALAGEYGWLAWTYSKTAKLNAWTWHGLGVTGTSNIHAWVQLGNALYLRRDGDSMLHLMEPDVFFLESDTNTESQSVYAETQWLDFGKPGLLKGIDTMDFDGKNITSVDFFISVDGNREGAVALSLPLSQDGWTYSGGALPVGLASTEFKLRFNGAPNVEVQVNRLTLDWTDMGDV